MNLFATFFRGGFPATFILALLYSLSGSASAQVQPPNRSSSDDAPASLTELFDAAPAGSVVIVPPGDYRRQRAVVSKPLTIIGGDPMPKIGRLTLACNGGALKLANLQIDQVFTPQIDPPGPAGYYFGFFDEIRASDITFTSGGGFFAYNYTEFVRVKAAPGEWLSGGGGRALFLDCEAAGLFANRLYTNDPTIECAASVPIPPVRLNDDMHMPEAPRLGGMLALSWSIPGPAALLFGYTKTREPRKIRNSAAGFWHLAGTRFLRVAVTSPGELTVQIPNDTTLIGMTTAFQVMGPGRHYSGPAVGIVLP